MAKVGSVEVKLKVDTGKFKTDIKSAEMVAKKFATKTARRFKTMAKSIKKSLGIFKGLAIASGVALVGFGIAITKTAKSIDLLAKSSAKFGISVGALQKLEFQAGLTGVSTTQLNTALEGMTRRIAEAATGTGEAQKALLALGLDARKLNDLPLDEKFLAIASATKNITGAANQAKVAYDIFGRSGMVLVNTLNSNLAKSGELFDSLGVKISDSQAKAVESFNDSKMALGLMFGSLMQVITARLSPALTKLSEKLQSMFKSGEIQKYAAIFSDKLVKGIILLKDSIPSIVSGFKSFGNNVIVVARGLAGVLKTISKISGLVNKAQKAMPTGKSVTSILDRVSARFKRFALSKAFKLKLESSIEVSLDKNKSITKVAEGLSKLEESMRKKADETTLAATGSSSGKGDGYYRIADEFGRVIEGFAKPVNKLDRTAETFKEAVARWEAGQEAIRTITDSSGSGEIERIFREQKVQAKNAEFDRLAREARDVKEAGGAGSEIRLQEIMASLREIINKQTTMVTLEKGRTERVARDPNDPNSLTAPLVIMAKMAEQTTSGMEKVFSSLKGFLAPKPTDKKAKISMMVKLDKGLLLEFQKQNAEQMEIQVGKSLAKAATEGGT